MTQIINQPPNPYMMLVDGSDRISGRTGLPSVIQFKFQPTDFTIDQSTAWGASNGMNRPAPILQFSHGEQVGYNFNMKLWAAHSDDSIDEDLEALRLSITKDDDLKRPPRWQFVWGQFIDETVVVQSLGGIKVDQLRSDGKLRGATLSIKLLIYRSIDVALVAEDRPTDTFFTIAKFGDTWESIALREYDEPAYGDALRQANPGVMFPSKALGKILKLPKLENVRNVVLAPSSIPLVRTAAGLALRNAMYAERSVSRQSAILKK